MKLELVKSESYYSVDEYNAHFDKEIELSPKYAIETTLKILEKLQSYESKSKITKADSIWIINLLYNSFYSNKERTSFIVKEARLAGQFLKFEKQTENFSISTFFEKLCNFLEIEDTDLYAIEAFRQLYVFFSNRYHSAIEENLVRWNVTKKPSILSYLKLCTLFEVYGEFLNIELKDKNYDWLFNKNISKYVNTQIFGVAEASVGYQYNLLQNVSKKHAKDRIESLFEYALNTVHLPFLKDVVNNLVEENVGPSELLEFSKTLATLGLTTSACETFPNTWFSNLHRHSTFNNVCEQLRNDNQIAEYAEAVMKHFFLNSRKTSTISAWNNLVQIYRWNNNVPQVNTDKFVEWMIANKVPSNTKTLILIKKMHWVFDSIMGFNYFFTKFYFSEEKTRGAKNMRTIEYIAQERGEAI